RGADPGGLAYWTRTLVQGMPIEQLAQALASSGEYFAQQQGVDLPLQDQPGANVTGDNTSPTGNNGNAGNGAGDGASQGGNGANDPGQTDDGGDQGSDGGG